MSRDESKKHKLCFYLHWLKIERLKLSEIWEIKLSRKTLNFIHHRSHYTKQNRKISRSLNTRQWLAQGTVGWPCCYNNIKVCNYKIYRRKARNICRWQQCRSCLSDSNSHTTSKVTNRQPPGIYNSLRQNLYTNQFKYPETSTSSNPGAVWCPDLSRYNSLQPP